MEKNKFRKITGTYEKKGGGEGVNSFDVSDNNKKTVRLHRKRINRAGLKVTSIPYRNIRFDFWVYFLVFLRHRLLMVKDPVVYLSCMIE